MADGGAAAGPLASGTHLGPYEILALAGSGGMGEVYRARDPRLGREVAIKLLPQAVAASRARVAAFEREARALASLNHPNVATVYGIERTEDHLFFAMELVAGQTLAERLRRGALTVEEALPLFEQLAEGLEAAHAKDIVHRDLKPSNLMVTPAGVLKILDFGLVLARSERPSANVWDGATTTSDEPAPSSTGGGTPAYKSPEQTRGAAVDRRTDIWSFGCCLYEALTGRRAFGGSTASDVIAAVLREEPDWSALPPDVPPAIRTLIRRCLEKDPRRRLHSAADARLEIADARDAGPDVQAVAPARAPGGARLGDRRLSFGLVLGIGTVLVLGILVARMPWSGPVPVPSPAMAGPTVRFGLDLPRGFHVIGSIPALSPDGRQVAFLAMDGAQRGSVWVRALDEVEARPVAGTEGARSAVFWDPEGRNVGFATDTRVRVVGVAGGEVQNVAEVEGVTGAAWGADQTILLGRKAGPLHRASLRGGGQAEPATRLDAAGGETAHLWPHFLPDGRHFLYVATSDQHPNALYAGATGSDLKKKLLEDVSNAAYVESGLLLFARRSTLMAQAFDPATLELSGEPFRVADPILHFVESSLAPFAASSRGVLVYRSAEGLGRSRLRWVDRRGQTLEMFGDPAIYASLALSPDDRRVVVERIDPDLNTDLWMHDLERGTSFRLTSGPERDSDPVWSSDGKWIAFARLHEGAPALQRLPAGGGPAEVLLPRTSAYPTDWSPDGKTLLYAAFRGVTGGGAIEWLPVAERRPQVFLQTRFNEHQARLSPDGRWIAYSSGESGRAEVYVDRFPAGGQRQVVSSAGGTQPMWKRAGDELYYLAGNGTLMALPVRTADGFWAGAGQALFESGLRLTEMRDVRNRYVVSADGQRFLFVVDDPDVVQQPSLTVVAGWRLPVP